MNTIHLHGCAPIPLAHYLKALGILRLVAESEYGDSAATAFWQGDPFVLNSRFDRETIVEFFLRDYEPTPLVVPWSGGDFFAVNRENPASCFEETPTAARVIEAVVTTESRRLENYRAVLRETFKAMDRAGVMTKKDIEGSGGPQRRMKAELLKSLRSSLLDVAIAWLDAASDHPSVSVLHTWANLRVANSGCLSGHARQHSGKFEPFLQKAVWKNMVEWPSAARTPSLLPRNSALIAASAHFSESVSSRVGLAGTTTSQRWTKGESSLDETSEWTCFVKRTIGSPNSPPLSQATHT